MLHDLSQRLSKKLNHWKLECACIIKLEAGRLAFITNLVWLFGNKNLNSKSHEVLQMQIFQNCHIIEHFIGQIRKTMSWSQDFKTAIKLDELEIYTSKNLVCYSVFTGD